MTNTILVEAVLFASVVVVVNLSDAAPEIRMRFICYYNDNSYIEFVYLQNSLIEKYSRNPGGGGDTIGSHFVAKMS